MLFSSLEFIFIFLPMFLMIYFITPIKYRKYIILLGSIIFYIIGSFKKPKYILLLFVTTIINFFIGKLIDKKENKKNRKRVLIFGIIYNVLWLILFKYFDFIVSIIKDITKVEINNLDLALPLGISFYTFELLSYLIDVYKNKCRAEKSFLKFSTYIFMFPKLISGPISRYADIKKDLNNKKVCLEEFILGVKYFILGLGLKVILANKIGCLWNDILMIGFDGISTKLAWIGIIAFSLEIYFDFYGYSLMAIGLGKIIGITIPENFKTPYLSLSMTEFFRRWHITLGKWFRDYIYIPLGGNRNGIVRTIVNLGIVWIITGLWHGANWNFIIWGIFVYILIIIEKLFLKKHLEKHQICGHIYMALSIVIMWSIFAITDLAELKIFLSKLFIFDKGMYALDYIKYLKMYGILLILGIISITKLPEKIFISKKTNTLQAILLIMVFWTSVYFIYKGLNNPFMYFSF